MAQNHDSENVLRTMGIIYKLTSRKRPNDNSCKDDVDTIHNQVKKLKNFHKYAAITYKSNNDFTKDVDDDDGEDVKTIVPDTTSNLYNTKTDVGDDDYDDNDDILQKHSWIPNILSSTYKKAKNFIISHTKLRHFGYTLTFNNYIPVFVKNDDFDYMYDQNLYLGDIIPQESLESLKIIMLKSTNFSP